MRKPKILVAGSFIMDQIVSTEVFPDEGESVFGRTFRKAPGGKGANQAVQAARLGADVTMVGKLGRDADGEVMLRTCREAGVNTEHILFDEEEASGCAVIILESRKGEQARNRIIVLPGANMTIRPEETAWLREEIGAYDMVMLQLEIPMGINEMIAEYAYRAGVPVMLNPAPYAPVSDGLLRHVTYVSPNEHEAAALTGVKTDRSDGKADMEQVREACISLRDRGAENVLVTLGENGAVLYNDGGFIAEPCARDVTAADPTAAGDSFTAAFCTGTVLGWETEDRLRFASHTAALTVSSVGAMPSLPCLDAVERFMAERGAAIPDTSALK